MSLPITRYKIVSANNYLKLEDIINEMIKDGWRPLGGVSVICNDCNWDFTQAMTTVRTTFTKWDTNYQED